jgi:hypothetical protein
MRKLPRNKLIAIGLVVVAAAAGGGAAIAGAAGSGSPSDFMDSVAQHLGISRQKLDDATKAAAVDQVDAQLKAGKITQAQADEMKKRIQAGDGGFFFGGPKGGRPFGDHGPGGPGLFKAGLHDSLAAAAKYLGLSEPALRDQLRSGKSLADVASAQNKDVAGLQQAILAASKADLDEAVAAKKLTQSQADDIYSHLKDRIADVVKAKPGDRPRFREKTEHAPGPGWFGP